MSWGGLNIRKSGTQILFDAFLLDVVGEPLTTGTCTLRLYEAQADGSLESYDFNDDTFKATALTTETLALTHQTGNAGDTDTGLWTAVLSTLTGLTIGNVYYVAVENSYALPTQQMIKFQYGGQEGQIRAEDIADDALTADKLAANCITTDQLADATITAAKIAANAITSAKIDEDAITSTQLSSDAIDNEVIADGAINLAKLDADVIISDSRINTNACLKIFQALRASMVTAGSIGKDLGTLIDAVGSGGDTVVTRLGSLAAAQATGFADLYAAAVDYVVDETASQDEFTATWYKNGVVLTSGVTSPTIQVQLRSTGADLIAQTPMSEIGSTHWFKYNETVNRAAAGDSLLITVRATIDAATRVFRILRSRDN